jgi:DNA-binding transcriptional ArsR family regulator
MAYQMMLSALADPTRRQIFESIVERPRNVRELAEELPVSRPAVSQHLRVLRNVGLVHDRRDGGRRAAARNPREEHRCRPMTSPP